MPKRTQIHLASIVLTVAIVLHAGFLLLTFYVPRLVATWAESGGALAVWERMLVRFSQFGQAASWPMLALLSVVLIASIVWRILAEVQYRRSVA